MYKVIKYFTDLQDNGHPYNVGDTYPRAGKEISEKRFKELSGSKNKQGEPLIKKIDATRPTNTEVTTQVSRSARKRKDN